MKRVSLLLFLVFTIVCRRNPSYIDELANQMDKTNKDLEDIAPFLQKTSKPQDVWLGLVRLDKAVHTNTTATIQLLRKYPEIQSNPEPVQAALLPRFKRMAENIRKISQGVDYWAIRMKDNKEYVEIIERIRNQTKKANEETQKL